MNDLIAILENKFGRENIAAFADDLSVITEETDALECIEAVKSWAQENDLELNTKKGKSAFLRLVLGNSPKDNLEEEIGGVKREREYKYLGVTINQNLNLDS